MLLSASPTCHLPAAATVRAGLLLLTTTTLASVFATELKFVTNIVIDGCLFLSFADINCCWWKTFTKYPGWIQISWLPPARQAGSRIGGWSAARLAVLATLRATSCSKPSPLPPLPHNLHLSLPHSEPPTFWCYISTFLIRKQDIIIKYLPSPFFFVSSFITAGSRHLCNIAPPCYILAASCSHFQLQTKSTHPASRQFVTSDSRIHC